MPQTLWADRIYQETALLIFGFLFLVGIALYFFPTRSPKIVAARASLRSWLFIVPILLLFFSLPFPWTVVIVTLIAIYGAKTFFKMVGMYHRSWFVWITYAYIATTAVAIHRGWNEVFNLLPMAYFATVCLVPLFLNSAKHMIQYLALSLMAYFCFGWCLMHLAKYLFLYPGTNSGILIVLYIYLLTEVGENASLLISRYLGRFKMLTQVSSRWTLEGIVGGVFLTILLAWGMRHLLPERDWTYWLAAGLICSLVGFLGDLLMSTIRRDLGVKSTGVFIIGRGDLLDRLDKLIFVAPAFFYTILHLNQWLA
jgi:phosphatidate cytidylyltransferase